MTRPTILVDGSIWKVYPTGRITVYGKDEFGLLFELGTGPERKRRFTRYSPLGSKSTDASLAELTERELLDLFHQSQPAWTSPEGGYGVRLVSFVVEFLAPLAKAAYAPEDVPGSVCPLPERPYETRSGLGVRPYDGGDIDSRTT